ncbi:hypothetical protein CFP65_5292 [Kitasatospora sp. MMS16-BH015]|uniref:hypothetical protein n=1 Tax=Kitasatospora sp. MMS16-BH015 TaxID=2018025 RepID=UPI000CA3202F|nr:hypothetical protein [Kitasatospora sp. MMS16-BH015]AUG80001.1 hypothetical protein CFP65_5292 [Kitasatospora sp. MMS16-BH015]
MPQQQERTRLDLSLTQVTASALAAIVGAVLASELGVYGTIIGAAVVSIGATTGGAVFAHLFRRTGEQLRTAVQQGADQTDKGNGLRQVEPEEPVPLGQWNEPQTLRSKRKWTWKSYALVSALVFGLAMTPIVVVELATGKNLHSITTDGQGGGTSFNPGRSATQPHSEDREQPKQDPAPPADRPSGRPSPSATPSGKPSGSPSATPSGSPSSTPSAPTPTPTPPPSGSPPPTGTPTGTKPDPGTTDPGKADAGKADQPSAPPPSGTPAA